MENQKTPPHIKEVNDIIDQISKKEEQGGTVLDITKELDPKTISRLQERGFRVKEYEHPKKNGIRYSIHWT